MPDLLHLYDEECAKNQYTIKRKCSKGERLLPRFELHPDDIVADFGCGTGRLTPFVAPLVKRYFGIDFSEPMIRLARKRIADAGIINAEFTLGRIPEFCREHLDTFTVGLALDISEHIADDNWLEILRAIHESLHPDGRLYLHTPNAEFFTEVLKSHDIILRESEGHIAVRSAQDNVLLLRQAGFTFTNVEYIPHYNILKYLHPFSHIPLIGRYLRARLFITACG